MLKIGDEVYVTIRWLGRPQLGVVVNDLKHDPSPYDVRVKLQGESLNTSFYFSELTLHTRLTERVLGDGCSRIIPHT